MEEINLEKTDRGFSIGEFEDRYGVKCSIQKSSLATENAIWFGVVDANPRVMDKTYGWVDYPIHEEVLLNTRMHLTQEDVKKLLPLLIKFAETGEL